MTINNPLVTCILVLRSVTRACQSSPIKVCAILFLAAFTFTVDPNAAYLFGVGALSQGGPLATYTGAALLLGHAVDRVHTERVQLHPERHTEMHVLRILAHSTACFLIGNELIARTLFWRGISWRMCTYKATLLSTVLAFFLGHAWKFSWGLAHWLHHTLLVGMVASMANSLALMEIEKIKACD